LLENTPSGNPDVVKKKKKMTAAEHFHRPPIFVRKDSPWKKKINGFLGPML
jgi:hypothetical protein